MMKKLNWLWLSLLVLPFALHAETPIEEGVHYFELIQQQPTTAPDKVEVVELFWYGCPHCDKFEPFVKDWEAKKSDDVAFVRVPATFRPIWEFHARVYYAAELLGVVDKIHEPMFHAIHRDNQRLDSPAAVEAIFTEHGGVSSEQFRKAFNSFSAVTKSRQAKLMVQRYEITGVPAIIVNGKYRVAGVGGFDQMLKTVDYLVAMERAVVKQ
ncbi:hypothetical protein BOW53_09280 [Solemya pervernicosa gill symbiont]|uniref:Thiol:disulfide interchange protein n=3 Tax=Gammaproteobacteria incertae sedis TaxID=118884 RepID=A0A1T2L4I3_9GAMM|nr:thiol:disulfide interchange protein DsbA/DsbL [Candidatus Reidiella endopervernicosa]OOZ40018.1 hypothetical protein BOW53_09280 [Solemya pervernicosa gill symbiont]